MSTKEDSSTATPGETPATLGEAPAAPAAAAPDASATPPAAPPMQATPPKKVEEIGGPKGPEPTRYGDWERDGRCVDF